MKNQITKASIIAHNNTFLFCQLKSNICSFVRFIGQQLWYPIENTTEDTCMTHNEKELLSMIKTEEELLIALQIISDFLTRHESSEGPVAADLPGHGETTPKALPLPR